jgi:hypothetical protein
LLRRFGGNVTATGRSARLTGCSKLLPVIILSSDSGKTPGMVVCGVKISRRALR